MAELFETRRVFELQIGDFFKLLFADNWKIVTSVKNGRIHFNDVRNKKFVDKGTARFNSLGWNSRQIVYV